MKLQVTPRKVGRKSELGRLRREKKIPAVLYSKGKQSEEIVVDGGEFQKLLNQIEKQTLSSKVLILKGENFERRVIVKGIQYEPTTYEVLHLDFLELHKDHKVTLNIPLRCTGVAACSGVKAGGTFRQNLFYVKVRVPSDQIPDLIEIDIADLEMGQTKKLQDAKFPAGIQVKSDVKEVAVVVAKR